MAEVVRTFIAIELPEAIRVALGDLQAELGAKEEARLVRWVAMDALHITLQFLGEVPAGRLPGVQGAVTEGAAGYESFSLGVGGLGCFPNPVRPSVVWVGLSGDLEVLLALQKSIEGNLQPLGFRPEGRPFSPHVTIGRVRRDSPPRELARLGKLLPACQVGELGEFRVEAVSLMRSDLLPTGAKYTCLGKGALGGRVGG